MAEQAELSSLGKGQQAVVFEQRCALHRHFGNFALFVIVQRRGVFEIALVIIHVDFARALRRDHLILARLEKLSEQRIERGEREIIEEYREHHYHRNAHGTEYYTEFFSLVFHYPSP